jgi:hypothetical protein
LDEYQVKRISFGLGPYWQGIGLTYCW